MNTALMAFSAIMNASSIITGRMAGNEAMDKSEKYLDVKLDQIRTNEDAKLEAMATTYLYAIRDMNNKHSAQSMMLTQDKLENTVKSNTESFQPNVRPNQSSYYQDTQAQIENEYSMGLTTMAGNYGEAFERMEMMNDEAIKQTMMRSQEMAERAIMESYTTKLQASNLKNRATMRGMGRLGSLGAFAWSKSQTVVDNPFGKVESPIKTANYLESTFGNPYYTYNPFDLNPLG